jgi:hypothetical protein
MIGDKETKPNPEKLAKTSEQKEELRGTIREKATKLGVDESITEVWLAERKPAGYDRSCQSAK